MKKITSACVWLCIAFTFLSMTVSASHDLGGNFSYQYISPLSYLVKYHFYRDCSGIPAPTYLTICVSSSQLDTAFNANLYTNGPPLPMTSNFCVPGIVTSCMGGSSFGMEELLYEDTVHLPATSNDWQLSAEDCCRSGILFMLSGNGILVASGIDNSNSLINSSPVFNQQPVPEFCIGIQANYDFSCHDPDGDSLVYSLVPASEGLGCPPTILPLSYSSPFSFTNFINSVTPIVLNAQTGMLSFTPTNLMSSVVCVRVDEYRNGQFIGYVLRDIGFVTTAGSPYYNLIKGKIFLDNNLNFIEDGGDRPLPGMFVETNPLISYSITGANGTYTVVVGDTGYYSFNLPFVFNFYHVIQNSQVAYFQSFGNTDSSNDFIIQPIPGIKDLSISMTRNARWGNKYYYRINFQNTGTDSLSGSIKLTPDSGLNYYSANPPASLFLTDTFVWNFSALAPLEQRQISVTLFNAQTGTMIPVKHHVAIEPVANDTLPTNNYFILHDTLLGPYDPNCKEVLPSGDLALAQVQNQEDLLYTIHFQNTGTDTAVNVVITDMLEPNLFVPSFRMEGASSPCTVSIDSANTIQFSFAGIMLPDSGADFAGSCGFVSFKIKPNSGLLSGDSLTNEANIYFDNNAPVLTNKTLIRILSPSVIESPSVENQVTSFYHIEDASIHFSGNDLKYALTYNIYDLSGRLVLKGVISTLPSAVYVGGLNPGVYFVSCKNHSTNYSSKLFISNSR